MMSSVIGPKWPFYSCYNYIGLLGTGFMQVMYLGRAPRTKETLPDCLKWRRVTRQPLVFRGLTGNQRTPGFGASQLKNMQPFIYYVLAFIGNARQLISTCQIKFFLASKILFFENFSVPKFCLLLFDFSLFYY